MRVIHCSGTPSARGEAVGVALRSEIEASVSFTMAWAADFGADRRRVEALLAPYDAATARHASDLAEVLDGMARGSGVDPVALRATNAFEELYALLDPEALGAPAERCTDALLAGVEGPILVHQEQWYAADADSVAVVVDRPDDDVAIVAPVVASGLPLVGMNATGASVGAMSLTATDEGPGVPRMIVARRALDARDREEAWRIVTTPERAGGYSYSFAFPDGATALFETTATTAADLGGSGCIRTTPSTMRSPPPARAPPTGRSVVSPGCERSPPSATPGRSPTPARCSPTTAPTGRTSVCIPTLPKVPSRARSCSAWWPMSRTERSGSRPGTPAGTRSSPTRSTS